jgi:hypothetical protein
MVGWYWSSSASITWGAQLPGQSDLPPEPRTGKLITLSIAASVFLIAVGEVFDAVYKVHRGKHLAIRSDEQITTSVDKGILAVGLADLDKTFANFRSRHRLDQLLEYLGRGKPLQHRLFPHSIALRAHDIRITFGIVAGIGFCVLVVFLLTEAASLIRVSNSSPSRKVSSSKDDTTQATRPSARTAGTR